MDSDLTIYQHGDRVCYVTQDGSRVESDTGTVVREGPALTVLWDDGGEIDPIDDRGNMTALPGSRVARVKKVLCG